MRVKINDFVLCDGLTDATQSPANLAVTEQRTTQVAKGLRWTSSKTLDRQNKETHISFQVTRRWDQNGGLGAAQKFLINHGQDVPNNGLVEFTFYDKSKSYLNVTQVQTVEGKHTGTTTIHHYTLIGGQTQVQKPTS